MIERKTVSDITRFYKFKEFIGDLATKFSVEQKVTPVYNIDYTIDGEKLGVFVKTELGGKFLAFIAQACLKVDTEKK